MSIPPVLRALLTAHGPSGYETAPAAVFRDAASAFAEVTHRRHGLGLGPRRRDGRRSDARRRRPHRRDRPDRHPHRRRRLPALHRRRRLGPAGPGRPAGRASPRARARPGRGRPQADPPPQGRRAQEGRRAQGLHIDIGAKDGDEARALVRIGDVAVIAGEPVELPNDRARRALDGQPPRLLCGLEAARLVAEAGGAPGDVFAVAAVAGGDDASAASTTAAYALRPDVAIVVDVTHATDAPGVDESTSWRAPVRLGAGHRARLDAQPARLRAAATRPPRPRGSRSPSQASARAHRHRRRRHHVSRGGIPRGARSACRCATCTRRSRWSSSTTWRTRRS